MCVVILSSIGVLFDYVIVALSMWGEFLISGLMSRLELTKISVIFFFLKRWKMILNKLKSS